MNKVFVYILAFIGVLAAVTAINLYLGKCFGLWYLLFLCF